MLPRLLSILVLVAGCVPTALDHERAPLTGSTIVSLTFDDTLADQYQLSEMLAARGLVATFYVNSPRFGRTGALTLSQALALQQQGHEIGGHTLDHVDLTTVSASELQRQICADRDALIASGFVVTSFAYPFGADNATVQNAVESCGYNSARDVGGLVAPGSCSGCPYGNTIPPANAYALRTQSSIRNTTTLDTLKLYVTQAEEHGGGWVPIVFHHVCDGCDTYAISPSTLAAFLDWLAARRSIGTEVATVDQVMGGDVTPPPPPPAGDTTPPTASVSRPKNGAVVSGTIHFWAAVSDNVGVVRVRFFVDNVQIAEKVETAYKLRWDTTTVTKGTHVLAVQAYDAAGNTTRSADITVTVR
jgi:peptidoglycan/xylan/chitin deacetylase (PgdA/CDA1 family)